MQEKKEDCLLLVAKEGWGNITQVNKLIKKPLHPIKVIPTVNNTF